MRLDEAERVAAPILEAVRTEAMTALLEVCAQVRWLARAAAARIAEAKLDRSCGRLSAGIREAVETASAQHPRVCEGATSAANISKSSASGRKLGQIVRPLDAVGCYIPSGRYPLPSTLLMTAILAQAAGVPRIVIASPKPTDEILGAAHLLGLSDVFRMGGAQAIAAMAYGTADGAASRSHRRPWEYLCGGGEEAAGRRSGHRLRRGPDGDPDSSADGDPRVIAADMLAQAEHDVDATAVLVTTSEALAHQQCRRRSKTQLADAADRRGRARSDRSQQRDHSGPRFTRRHAALERLRAGAPEPARCIAA